MVHFLLGCIQWTSMDCVFLDCSLGIELEWEMKPRLRKIYQMWFCRDESVTGIGYSPLMAWEDWADLTRNHWRLKA